MGAERPGAEPGGPPPKRARRGGAQAGAGTGAAGGPAAEGPASLPVHGFRKEIVEAVGRHRVVVLVGETGSGKTTQVPQFLYDAGFARQGVVAVTQPRRIAAISVAARVASEMGCSVGGLVGYHVRFSNHTSAETRLKYMTDGMLVRECTGKHGLRSCSVVVLDEAHERSIHTDVLLGLVKSALDDGAELRVMVMSATLEAHHFVKFFGGPKHAHLLTVPGRQHPVQIYYTPTPEPDYLEAALVAVLQLHLMRPRGDVLVFLPGQEDIDGLARLLEEKRKALAERRRERPQEPLPLPPASGADAPSAALPPAIKVDDFIVRPIFASLPFDQQELVFQPAPPGCRKLVLATNIAETSITIPGIRYVVDTGLVKLKICHPQTGVELLQLVETSKASASQRAGRAGREAPGEAYRLYAEPEHAKMPSQTPAEILRCEMSSVYLQLKALGIAKIPTFPLVDRPPQEALVKAAHFLCRIGALDRSDALTEVGHKLAMLPIHPLHAYCLLVATEFDCVAEVLSIVSMLSAETPFFASTGAGRELPPAAKGLLHGDGDHLSLLRIYAKWSKHAEQRSFARQHALNHSALERAATIRAQLKELVQASWGARITSCGGEKHWATVRRCLLKACFTQTARRDDVHQNAYLTLLSHQKAKLHPSSALFRRWPPPACVIYSELVTTTRNYLRVATEVDPLWLPELCPQHFAASAAAVGK